MWDTAQSGVRETGMHVVHVCKAFMAEPQQLAYPYIPYYSK